jgi:Trypsin
VSKFVIHQNYDDIYTLNDIALLFLDSPVMGVTPIKLNTDIAVPTDGQVLKAIGFGATDGEGTNLADELMEVDLPKFNDKSCNGIYFDSLDATTMVCAGGYPEGVNKDTCGGDSGNKYTTSYSCERLCSCVC